MGIWAQAGLGLGAISEGIHPNAFADIPQHHLWPVFSLPSGLKVEFLPLSMKHIIPFKNLKSRISLYGPTCID